MLQREEDDIRLSELLSKLLGEQLDRVLVDPNWAKEDRLLFEELAPILLEIALREALREIRRLEAMKQDNLRDKILLWVWRYAGELVKDINATTQTQLAEALESFITKEQTMGELREAVSHIFTPERAQTIAVTEITKAYVEGGRIAADELRQEGFNLVDIWYAHSGGNVCEECESRDEKEYGDGWTDYPPLHPNCVCTIEREMRS